LKENDATQVYTVQEVANLLNAHIETVRRLLRDKRLKGFKLNHSWRISKEQLQEFLDQNR
jgi:excisionase family DNA binding protein